MRPRQPHAESSSDAQIGVSAALCRCMSCDTALPKLRGLPGPVAYTGALANPMRPVHGRSQGFSPTVR